MKATIKSDSTEIEVQTDHIEVITPWGRVLIINNRVLVEVENMEDDFLEGDRNIEIHKSKVVRSCIDVYQKSDFQESPTNK